MNIRKFGFLLAAVVLLVSSCKTTSFQAEKPKESYLPSNLAPVMSEFPLQVEIDVKKLEATVNKKVNGLVYQGSNLNNQDLSVKIWKAQNITFTVKNNVIEYRVPLKVWSRFAWKVEKFGLTVSDHYDATGTIALTYKTRIDIDKNWKLQSTTTSSGYQWIETPKLNLIGISVPVTPIANIALNQSDKMVSNQIDQALAQMIDLKKYVQLAWNAAQKPMQVSETNNLWIRVTPKDVYVSPFSTSGQKLDLAVSLYGQVESFMGAQPAENALVPLPAYKVVQHAPQQFNVNVAADATYDKISEMAKSQLVNKTFEDGKKSITVTDLSIYGSEGKPVFVADVTGSLKGKVYFTGNLVYNAEKKAIEIEHPEFDVKTKNALVKSANWLLHGMILNKMKPYLTYPVTDLIEEMKSEANKTLTNYPIYDGINLQGNVNTVNVTGLNMVSGAVRITANLKGNVAIKVDDLNF